MHVTLQFRVCLTIELEMSKYRKRRFLRPCASVSGSSTREQIRKGAKNAFFFFSIFWHFQNNRPRKKWDIILENDCSSRRQLVCNFDESPTDLGNVIILLMQSTGRYCSENSSPWGTNVSLAVSRLQPHRVQSRRRVAPINRVRSKERSWANRRHEFHGGALPGCGVVAHPPGLLAIVEFSEQ